MRIWCFGWLAALVMLASGAAAAQEQPHAQVRPRMRIVVADITHGTAPIDAELREALRARIEEAFAATRVFAIETRRAGEAAVIASERAQIARARAQNINLIVFSEVDSLTCYREARPITAMPGKYNLRAACDAVMRVRVINPATDELRASFELDESHQSSLGVIDQLELGMFVNPQAPNVYRAPVRGPQGSREFVALAQELAAALTERVYDDAYPPEVIEMIDDQIYISRGRRGGFQVGDRLGVFSRTGRQLRHPVTGEIMGEAAARVATATITESRDDYSVGALSEVTGEVEIGALVRR